MPTVLSASATTEDFAGMVETIMAETKKGDLADELSAIKRSITRQLEAMRTYRFWFTEANANLTLVVDQDEYQRNDIEGTTATKLPSTLLDIDHLRLLRDTSYLNMVRVSLGELRHIQTSTNYKGQPYHWTWHHERLIVSPIPSAADTLNLDYHKDSTLADNGQQITVQSSTHTNDWFKVRGGEALLRAAAVMDFATTFLHDNELASFYSGLFQRHEKKLRDEYALTHLRGARVRAWGL